jgi:hypothetical protein
MSYRPFAVAATAAVLSVIHIPNLSAQSVYVAPGGVYIGAGAGPVYVSPGVPNGAAAYAGPGYGYGYGAAAYVDPGYDDYGYGLAAYDGYAYGAGAYPGCNCGYATASYVDPGSGYYGYGSGAYVAPRFGYAYGARPYLAPRMVPHRRYYDGPRSGYAAALPARRPIGMPYRTGRAIRR